MRDIALVTGASSGIGKRICPTDRERNTRGSMKSGSIARRREQAKRTKKRDHWNKSEDSSIRSYEGRKL